MNHLQAKVNVLGRRQVESQVELPLQDAARDALLPSVLDRAFEGELRAAPSVLRTSPPNATTEIKDAYSTVKSSDLGETMLWDFSVRLAFGLFLIDRIKSLPFWGGWRGRMETDKDRQIEHNEERLREASPGKTGFRGTLNDRQVE